MAAAIKEWNTVYKDQAPTPECSALDKDLTVSDKACGRMQGKVDQHGKPVRSKLIASTRPAPSSTSHREKTAECRRWRLSCGSGPTRRADLCPPNHSPQLACVFTRHVRGHDSWPADTMRRMHTTQRRPQPGTRLCQPHGRPLQSGHACTDTLLNPNGPSPPAVDGRIMSVLKQHLCDSGEIRNTLTAHGHPLTYWSTNPVDAAFGARIDPYSVPWEAHRRLPTTDSGTQGGRSAGPHVSQCTATWQWPQS
jgi:hypothetical protein